MVFGIIFAFFRALMATENVVFEFNVIMLKIVVYIYYLFKYWWDVVYKEEV